MKQFPNIKHSISRYSIFLFVLSFILISWFYNFNKTTFLPPQAAHIWRQVDCLSFTINYMEEGRNFLNPSINYVGLAGDGEMITDFPIIFYTIAQIWKITGQEEWIYRLLVFILFSIGLTSIFVLLKRYTQNIFFSFLAALLLFTSPVIAYYSNNFVMNIVAFSFALMGLAAFGLFVRTSKTQWIWISAMFYLLGGLIKIPALMSFVVIVFIYLTDVLGIISYKAKEKIFPQKFVQGIPLVLVAGVVLLWVTFMKRYNEGNGGIFLSGIYPIWDLTSEQIRTIISDFRAFWYRQHFHLSLQIASIVAFLWTLIHFRKLTKIERVFIVLLPIGVILFVVLWFQAMPNHDYYLTNSYILFVVTWGIALKVLNTHYPKVVKTYAIQSALTILLVFNAFYCKKELSDRYTGWWNTHYLTHYAPLIEMKPMLRELGISHNDTIIAMADDIPNATLYYLDVKGWSNYGGAMNNLDLIKVQKSIAAGAKYMVVLDSIWLQKDFVKPFTQHRLLEYKGIQVFQLKP